LICVNVTKTTRRFNAAQFGIMGPGGSNVTRIHSHPVGKHARRALQLDGMSLTSRYRELRQGAPRSAAALHGKASPRKHGR
jgi:hypothetical protein